MTSDDCQLDSLGGLPSGAPRSKLEPHYNLIRDLRKRRCTYQQIARFLKDRLNLAVAPSTIHSFVAIRAKRRRAQRAEYELPPSVADTVPNPPEPPGERLVPEDPIGVLRRRRNVERAKGQRYEFVEGEPLRLMTEEQEGIKHE